MKSPGSPQQLGMVFFKFMEGFSACWGRGCGRGLTPFDFLSNFPFKYFDRCLLLHGEKKKSKSQAVVLKVHAFQTKAPWLLAVH